MNHNGHGVPGGAGNQQNAIQVQSREDVTTQHVGTLLSVIQNLSAVLTRHSYHRTDDDDERWKKDNARFDGGTTPAIQHTIIRACERLDEVLADTSRWTLGKENDLQEAIIKMHNAQEKLAEENLELVRTHKRPCAIWKPQLATVEPKDRSTPSFFIAFWGDINKPGFAIIGRGQTPEAALLDYDEKFKQTPAQQIQLIANEQQPPLDQ